ncbi:hypothetical protein CVT24_010795 [Panaeolus cyanescens]|uniref:Uncharacterized protein n=1 Tax=Panaeolus cyanescens TaxID=181874 RepID=A0A409VGS9_9AGAR|nr:hypothetical protein CVT24_010795 [Panaeolus cyanescens]
MSLLPIASPLPAGCSYYKHECITSASALRPFGQLYSRKTENSSKGQLQVISKTGPQKVFSHTSRPPDAAFPYPRRKNGIRLQTAASVCFKVFKVKPVHCTYGDSVANANFRIVAPQAEPAPKPGCYISEFPAFPAIEAQINQTDNSLSERTVSPMPLLTGSDQFDVAWAEGNQYPYNYSHNTDTTGALQRYTDPLPVIATPQVPLDSEYWPETAEPLRIPQFLANTPNSGFIMSQPPISYESSSFNLPPSSTSHSSHFTSFNSFEESTTVDPDTRFDLSLAPHGLDESAAEGDTQPWDGLGGFEIDLFLQQMYSFLF